MSTQEMLQEILNSQAATTAQLSKLAAQVATLTKAVVGGSAGLEVSANALEAAVAANQPKP